MNDQGDDTAAAAERGLRALAERLLEGPLITGDWAGPAHLLVGILPPDLPFSLPLPSDSYLIGTLARPDAVTATDDDVTFAIVVLDAPEDAATMLAFYRDRLQALGLRAVLYRDFGSHFDDEDHGFVTQTPDEDPTEFRLDAHNLGVRLYAEDNDAGGAKVQVALSYVALEQNRPRHQRRLLRGFYSSGEAPPPRIEAPEGATQSQVGSHWGDDTGSLTGWLESDLAFTSIAEHYIDQLRRAGWNCTVDQRGEQISWSRWRFTTGKRQMRALFSITRQPWTEHGYTMHLAIERVTGTSFAVNAAFVAARAKSLGSVFLDDVASEDTRSSSGLNEDA
jgi:hypothetical protein